MHRFIPRTLRIRTVSFQTLGTVQSIISCSWQVRPVPAEHIHSDLFICTSSWRLCKDIDSKNGKENNLDPISSGNLFLFSISSSVISSVYLSSTLNGCQMRKFLRFQSYIWNVFRVVLCLSRPGWFFNRGKISPRSKIWQLSLWSCFVLTCRRLVVIIMRDNKCRL
jgi:hypothetical protein